MKKDAKSNTEEILSEIISLRGRYLDQQLIDSAFKAIASTRKSGKVKNSILLTQLRKWKKYPVEQVQSGMEVYIERDYAAKGKNEKYLLDIISNNVAFNNIVDLKSLHPAKPPKPPKSLSKKQKERRNAIAKKIQKACNSL